MPFYVSKIKEILTTKTESRLKINPLEKNE